MGGTVQNRSLRTGCSLDCLKYIVLAQCIMMRNGWCGLDWFTPHSFADGMVVAQSLRNSNVDLDIEQVSQDTLDGSVKGVPVTFLQYQYPLLRPLEQWNEMSCPLASLEDLACMKLSAIAQRGARKDFCDIYALGKKAFSLSQMLNFYQKKFSIRDIGSVLYGLVYFDDAESERMLLLYEHVGLSILSLQIIE